MGREISLSKGIPILPREIKQAYSEEELVLFVGAGASRLLDLPSWSGLAKKVLEDLQELGYLNFSRIDQLKGLNPQKQLSIADIIAKDNDAELDIPKHLKGESDGNDIYKFINDMGCCCVTTNYDELLNPRFLAEEDKSKAQELGNRVYDKERFEIDLLSEPGAVVHLHGSVSRPRRMVVTTKQYLKHYKDIKVQAFLKGLFANKTVLFIGYGLEDMEILEYLLKKGSVIKPELNDGRQLKSSTRMHFALQGFFLSQKTLYEDLHAYYKESFGIDLVGFALDDEMHKGLENVIKFWAFQIMGTRKQSLVDDYNFMNEVLDSN